MTDNAWAGLTEAQRKLLRRLINREQYPEFEIISRDGIHDSTVKALQSRGLIEDSYVLRLTPAGRAVYEASQAIDTPATEDADALTSAQARIAELESDTNAAAQSLTTALMQAADKVTELRAVLKATRDHIETFRNKTEMPPSVYVALTDMTLRIDDALEAHKQERAADAMGEGD